MQEIIAIILVTVMATSGGLVNYTDHTDCNRLFKVDGKIVEECPDSHFKGALAHAHSDYYTISVKENFTPHTLLHELGHQAYNLNLTHSSGGVMSTYKDNDDCKLHSTTIKIAEYYHDLKYLNTQNASDLRYMLRNGIFIENPEALHEMIIFEIDGYEVERYGC